MPSFLAVYLARPFGGNTPIFERKAIGPRLGWTSRGTGHGHPIGRVGKSPVTEGLLVAAVGYSSQYGVYERVPLLKSTSLRYGAVEQFG